MRLEKKPEREGSFPYFKEVLENMLTALTIADIRIYSLLVCVFDTFYSHIPYTANIARLRSPRELELIKQVRG